MRLLSCVLCCALFAVFSRADDPKPAAAGPGNWVTIKGQVVFPADVPIPKRNPLNVNAAPCLVKGPILDESIIVNATNRGIKNVVVWLRPDDAADPKAKFAANQIHPADAKRKPAQVVIDQPCCMFVDRVTCARVGDTLVVKNTSPIVHNFLWSSANNGECNANIPANGKHELQNPLAAEPAPLQYKCTVHGWMTGYVRIFDHPYYALTDENGNFEIPNAPAGKFRIVYWHENGLRGGAKGRFGEPIDIVGPTMAMKPTDFNVTPK